ncbi:TetR/AcrR family transcriptional regulator [Thalassobius sp. I31.1]|uniref:TetR/AcrR family transcriptional regulator n=1 Tax=Thalassobius sp. I31.1 TaxID=2109912 RepID=UPI000D1B8900|nr:TetR/AcrR family transcriptional regulator [Thalassobius sp. I31.1]
MARTIAKDHDQKRLSILKAAAKTFATEGFDGASMAQLARECGISKANIYHYYGSKDAILFDVLDAYLTDLRTRICDFPLEGTPAENLRALIGEILMAYQGADYEHQVQAGGMSSLPEDQQTLLRGYQRDMVRSLNNAICAVNPAAFEGDKEKLRNMTMSVFGMLNWYYMWNSGAGSDAREAYARHVADLTLGGLEGL